MAVVVVFMLLCLAAIVAAGLLAGFGVLWLFRKRKAGEQPSAIGLYLALAVAAVCAGGLVLLLSGARL